MAGTPGFMLGFKQSEFHQTCIPADRRAAAAAAQTQGSSKHSDGEYTKCDAVTQDTIWKQSVDTEKRGVKQWEQNWGFLTEFDPKDDGSGRPKTPKDLPEKASVFSENVPNTNSGNYGNRIGTGIGQTMQQLEFQFHSQNRKKKLGDDMVCY